MDTCRSSESSFAPSVSDSKPASAQSRRLGSSRGPSTTTCAITQISRYGRHGATICAITHMQPRSSTSQDIADWVREERRRQGLDQEQLALVANVAVRSVHRIEHAEETVRFDILLRVLDA